MKRPTRLQLFALASLGIAFAPGLPMAYYASYGRALPDSALRLSAPRPDARTAAWSLFDSEFFKHNIAPSEQERLKAMMAGLDSMDPERLREQLVSSNLRPSRIASESGDFPVQVFSADFIRRYKIRSENGTVKASEPVRALIASRQSGQEQEVDPYALTEYESDSIQLVAAMQAAVGQNDPLARQAQAWQLAEMDRLLADSELLEIMEQYFPVPGFTRGMKVADLAHLEQETIRADLSTIPDEELSVRLDGVAFQIYNLADILGKYAGPADIEGTPFEAFPVLPSSAIEGMLNDSIQTRALLIDALRGRGLL